MTEPVVQTRELTRRFGRRTVAVRSLDLSVPEGSIFALLGPNGAGKTTAIKMLMNILEPTSGCAHVLGMDSRRLGPAEFAQIGYVSENQLMPGWMTVNRLVRHCKPMYPTWDDAFCESLIKQFDLPLNRRLRGFSRGMRVKAALLSSIAYRPKLLVLDEPFSGLDPLVRDEFIRGMLELTNQENWTVFISSHDIDEVERLADWVGLIDNGDLRLAEPVAELQSRFRQVEAVVGDSESHVARPHPEHWLLPEKAAHLLRFVDTRYDEQRSHEKIRKLYPEASGIETKPMTLREIFLVLARHYRMNTRADS